MPNALLINAFQLVPGISNGQLSETMLKAIRAELSSRGYEIKETTIASGYDVNEEVDKHVWADLIILQSPVYWFSTPWIYKKYVDEVLTTGYAQQKLLTDDGRTRNDPTKQYGSGGKLQGKRYMLSLTWNAPKEAFDDPKQDLFQGKSVDDVFVSNTANYRFCGMEILPAFSSFNVLKDPQIERDLARIKTHLKNVL
jgi:modulator of drug activity B